MRTWFSDLKNIFLGNDLYSKDLQISLSEEIEFWREKIFINGLRFAFYFSFIAVAASVYSLFRQERYILVGLELFHLVSLTILVFTTNISSYLKKIFLAIIVFIVGVDNIIILGNPGTGYFFLFIIPIYSGFFFGHKSTLYNLLAMLAFLLFLGIGEEMDLFPYPVSPDNNSDSYFVFFIDFFLLCSVISISISHLFRKLNITTTKEDKVKKLLELEQKRLFHAKEKAEVADRLKSAFLANMSHEIRTPLNGILGFAELLKDEDINNTDRKEYVSIIINNGKHLLNLINDIIDISKIESRQLNVKPTSFNPDDLLNELFSFFENHKKSIEKDHIELILSITQDRENTFIFSDKTRLKQVLSNLIDNSLKFTENGRVEFGYTFLNNEEIEFFVEDTGIGISKEDIEIIFERFRQAESVNRRSMHGTGLGLSICKALIELMGGEIKVTSELNNGSRFSFILPLDHFTDFVDSEEENLKSLIDLDID